MAAARKSHLLIAACVATTSLIATAAWACSCARPESARAQLANADVAFVGRVERTTPRRGAMAGEVSTRFVILRSIKGIEAGRTVAVDHHTVSATCGLTFERDDYVLILASRHDGRLHTGLCQQAAFDQRDYEAAAGRTG